jgi:hypothetical protein
LFEVAPIAGSPDLYKITPAAPLKAGHYALYDVDVLNRGDYVFTLAAVKQGQAYYFAVEDQSAPSANIVPPVRAEEGVCDRPGVAVIGIKNAALTSGPDFFPKTKEFLPIGTEVTVSGISENGFCQVESRSNKGWVRAISLKRKG